MSSLSDADDAAPLAPIARLVATIKAERAASAGLGAEERERLTAELRRFAAAHEQERSHWQEAMDALKAERDQFREAAQAAEARHEQVTQQHRQAMADLELKHDHQRSIWQLDRRRLEITIAGQETAHQARRSRFSMAAALLVAGVFGRPLVADHRLGASSGEAADAQISFPASGSSR